MSDILVRIKRAALGGNLRFTLKARTELRDDGLGEMDVKESILNAVAIYKTLRTRSPIHGSAKEKLYIIVSPNLAGLPLYTKGKLVKEPGGERFYVLISSKVSIRGL